MKINLLLSINNSIHKNKISYDHSVKREIVTNKALTLIILKIYFLTLWKERNTKS